VPKGTDTVPTGQFGGASGGMKKINEFLDDPIMDKYYYTNRFKVYDSIKEGVILATPSIKSIDENVLYQYRRYYVRENKNNVCPIGYAKYTLTANMGVRLR
jgi:DNA (cytosine-5)-methyltransferase 1